MIKTWCQKSSLRVAMLLQLALASAGPVLAEPETLDELQAVNDRELDSMRGGYASSGGLEISFGIEQAVFIDGILQAVTTFNSGSATGNLPDPRVVGQNTGLISASGVQLVLGGLAPMDTEAVRSHLFTVVQNSQDNKIIDNITQINATVSSLGIYREMNLLSSLQHQLINARR
jgi:hypothetical protein